MKSDCFITPDKELFSSRLYDQYGKFVLKEAWKYCSNVQDVEDLTQEIWEKMSAKSETLQQYSHEQLCAYLAVSVRNQAVSSARKKKDKYSLDVVENITYNETDILDEYLDREYKKNAFYKYWQLVPQPSKELLERKYLLHETDQEIGHAMNMSPDSVRMALSRARKKAFATLLQYRDTLL